MGWAAASMPHWWFCWGLCIPLTGYLVQILGIKEASRYQTGRKGNKQFSSCHAVVQAHGGGQIVLALQARLSAEVMEPGRVHGWTLGRRCCTQNALCFEREREMAL